MQKLNELVELAKNATPGPWKTATDWERAAVYSTSKDAYPENKRVVCSGNQNNHKRFNAEPWSGSDWNDAAFIAAANPATILAISAAFRALEQSLEAEIHRADQNAVYLEALTERMLEAEQRAEAAEAKLAERDQLDEEAMHCATILEFIGSFDSDAIPGDEVDLRFEIDGEDTGCDVSITEYALRSAKAIRFILSGASISRPAPAVNLAELVPEWTNEQCLEFLSIAFRHAEISGDIEMDDIRLAVKMVNAGHANPQ